MFSLVRSHEKLDLICIIINARFKPKQKSVTNHELYVNYKVNYHSSSKHDGFGLVNRVTWNWMDGIDIKCQISYVQVFLSRFPVWFLIFFLTNTI